MRWYVIGLLVIAASCIWLVLREGQDSEIPRETAHGMINARPAQEVAPGLPQPNSPTLPKNARIRIHTGPRSVTGDGNSDIEVEWQRSRREEFKELFEQFRQEARLTDDQTRAVLVVLYDAQETYRAAFDAIPGEPNETDKAHAFNALGQVYTDSVNTVHLQLTEILTPSQLQVWYEVGFEDKLMIRLVFDTPLEVEGQ